MGWRDKREAREERSGVEWSGRMGEKEKRKEKRKEEKAAQPSPSPAAFGSGDGDRDGRLRRPGRPKRTWVVGWDRGRTPALSSALALPGPPVPPVPTTRRACSGPRGQSHANTLETSLKPSGSPPPSSYSVLRNSRTGHISLALGGAIRA